MHDNWWRLATVVGSNVASLKTTTVWGSRGAWSRTNQPTFPVLCMWRVKVGRGPRNHADAWRHWLKVTRNDGKLAARALYVVIRERSFVVRRKIGSVRSQWHGYVCLLVVANRSYWCRILRLIGYYPYGVRPAICLGLGQTDRQTNRQTHSHRRSWSVLHNKSTYLYMARCNKSNQQSLSLLPRSELHGSVTDVAGNFLVFVSFV